MMERQRGQTLPLWIGGILISMALMFFTLNYANMVRWQIRAQNAADAAAGGLLAIQTSNWNRMQIMLYTSSIEEFRIRRLIDAVVLSATRSGNCTDTTSGYPLPSPAATGNTCFSDYMTLKRELTRAVTRFGQDVYLLHNYSVRTTKSNVEADMQTMLTHIKNHCYNQLGGGGGIEGADCAFDYTLVARGGRTQLQGIAMDAFIISTPRVLQDNVTMMGGVAGFNGASSAYVNQQLWLPERIDLVACALIPPLIPSFGKIMSVPFYAVGRSAQTSVMVLQDWMQPGLIGDPGIVGSSQFQGTENPANEKLGSGYDNFLYTINYGGNNNTAYPQYRGFVDNFTNDEFSVEMGWWGSIPIQAFGGQVTPGQNVSCPVPGVP